ncbi:hypothetical protein [Leifsonia sp. EB41]|uniref:hypothetical protein n=1 Tax=Leifsonia sp. EB41 TaxID=3156260 RepID=UPI003518229C
MDLRAELLRQAFDDTDPEDYPARTYRRLRSTDADLCVYAWSADHTEPRSWQVYAEVGDVEDEAAARKAAQALKLVAIQVQILNGHGRVFEVDADNTRTKPIAGGMVYVYRQERKIRCHPVELMPHLDRLSPGDKWGSGDVRYDCTLIGTFGVMEATPLGTGIRLLIQDVVEPTHPLNVTDEGEDG